MRQATLLSAFIFLSGCASSPGWVKPWTWFGHEEPAADAEIDKPYPNLSTVPAKPAAMTPEDKRKQLMEGLVADRANAIHTDEVLRSTPESMPASPAPQASAAPQAETLPAPATVPAPVPAPAAPVAAAPVAAMPAPAPETKRLAIADTTGQVELDFAAGSTKMDPAEQSKLSTLAAIQKEGGGHIRVIGYAGDELVKAKDEGARKLALFDLSMRRAQAVAAEFMRLGVTGTALIVEARGSDDGAARKVQVTLE